MRCNGTIFKECKEIATHTATVNIDCERFDRVYCKKHLTYAERYFYRNGAFVMNQRKIKEKIK